MKTKDQTGLNLMSRGPWSKRKKPRFAGQRCYKHMDSDQHTLAPNTCIPFYKFVLYAFQDSHLLVIYSSLFSNPFPGTQSITCSIMVQHTSVRNTNCRYDTIFQKGKKIFAHKLTNLLTQKGYLCCSNYHHVCSVYILGQDLKHTTLV